jgi:hypothetical protein
MSAENSVSDTAEETSESPIVDRSLPSHCEWQEETTEMMGCVAGVGNASSISVSCSNGVEVTIPEFCLGVVVGSIESLRDCADASTTIQTPSTYDECHDIGPIYLSTTTGHGGEAWGFRSQDLETVLRVATNGEDFDESEVDVAVFKNPGCLVIEGPEHTWLHPKNQIGCPDEPVFVREVAGLSIENETNQDVLAGVKNLKSILEVAGIRLASFIERDSRYLKFRTPSDHTVEVAGYLLSRLATATSDLSEYRGTHSVKPRFADTTHQYEWTENVTEHSPGEYWVTDRGKLQYVFGYRKYENRVTRGHGSQEYGVGVRVKAKPEMLEVSLSDRRDQTITVKQASRVGSEVVAEVAFEQPDHHDPDEIPNPNLWSETG